MSVEEKYREIVKRLLAKTRDREVQWKDDSAGRSHGGVKGAFRVFFPQSSIFLVYVSPTAAPDFIRLDFTNSKGEVVDSWAVEDEESDWQLLKDLYVQVRHQALGFEDVLSDIEQAISKKGVIGLQNPSK